MKRTQDRTHRNRSPLIAPKSTGVPDTTFIYVIKSLHAVKIGKAANLYIRLSNLRVDNPHNPELVRYWTVPLAIADRVDVYTRHELAENWICGDWYGVAGEDAVAAVERMIDAMTELHLKRSAA